MRLKRDGKMWAYELTVFGRQIVPYSKYSSIKEVALNTLWWLRRPSKWRKL